MSKAILVLDGMPGCCFECPFYIGGMYGKGLKQAFITMCGVTHKEKFEDIHKYRLHDCPLKEAPKQMGDANYEENSYATGYNQALIDCKAIE